MYFPFINSLRNGRRVLVRDSGKMGTLVPDTVGTFLRRNPGEDNRRISGKHCILRDPVFGYPGNFSEFGIQEQYNHNITDPAGSKSRCGTDSTHYPQEIQQASSETSGVTSLNVVILPVVHTAAHGRIQYKCLHHR